MNIGIVGGRDFKDYSLLENTVLEFIKENGMPCNIVSGGATGADAFAEQLAGKLSIQTLIFLPDYKKYKRGAYLKRNTQIIDNSDVVFAFWDGTSIGTKDSISKARKMGKKLKIINY